ncbi:hypothetical protein RB213_002103 [Colletotrichum asianum]
MRTMLVMLKALPLNKTK